MILFIRYSLFYLDVHIFPHVVEEGYGGQSRTFVSPLPPLSWQQVLSCEAQLAGYSYLSPSNTQAVANRHCRWKLV